MLRDTDFDASWSEGRAMSLDEAVSYALEATAQTPRGVPDITATSAQTSAGRGIVDPTPTSGERLTVFRVAGRAPPAMRAYTHLCQ